MWRGDIRTLDAMGWAPGVSGLYTADEGPTIVRWAIELRYRAFALRGSGENGTEAPPGRRYFVIFVGTRAAGYAVLVHQEL